MALTKIGTDGVKDDAVTSDKVADSINSAIAANTAKDMTAVSASNLTSGTVPDARFPATLPAVSAANLTSVPAANITGTLPAISGANLTGISTTPADGSITQAKLNFPVANRNLIINGAFQVAQRGTSSTSTGYQTVDRFATSFGGHDEAITQAQVDLSSSDTPYSSGFRKAFKLTNGNQTSGADTADYVSFYQSVEAQDLANSGWNYTDSNSKLTIQFWAKSSVAKTFILSLYTQDGTDYAYNHKYALAANTWTKITHTFPGNSNLTFDNDNGLGIQFQWLMYFGTQWTSGSTVDQWVVYNGNTSTPDDTSDWWTTNDATFEITGVQLEVGSVTTDFEHRSFGQELALCQRYYYKTFPYGTAPARNLGNADSIHLAVVSGYNGSYHFKQAMRASPTLTFFNPSADNANQTSNSGGCTNRSTDNMISVEVGNTAGNHYTQFVAESEL